MTQAILLTGASGGFGRLTAASLLADGHRVVTTMRDPAGRNRHYAEALTDAGAVVVDMDVTSDEGVERAISEALKHLGGSLDVVINNAGIGVHGLQEAFTTQDWMSVFDVNVFGVVRVNRAALPIMHQQGHGLLIHVSSLLGRVIFPFYGPYNASKWALEALAENYRVELASAGIDVAIVEPGGYNTEFSSNLLHPADSARGEVYGDFGRQPSAMLAAFQAQVAATPDQDPQRVADAICALIAMPAGERPFRTEVDALGMGKAIAPYNNMLEVIHRQLLGGMGLSALLERNVFSEAR